MSINLIDGRNVILNESMMSIVVSYIRTTNYKGNGLKRVWAMLHTTWITGVALKSSDKPLIIICNLGITGFHPICYC